MLFRKQLIERKGRHLLVNFFVLVSSAFLLFIIGEISIRFIYFLEKNDFIRYRHHMEDHEKRKTIKNIGKIRGYHLIRTHINNLIIFEMRPLISGIYANTPVQINSLGMRDREYEVEKPSNTFRIAGLGDSATFGWGLELSDSFLKQLEGKLNDFDNQFNYEVLNLGVPAYNTVQEVESFIATYLKMSPDLIIIFYMANDMALPLFIKEPINIYSYNRSYLFEFINKRFGIMKDRLKAGKAVFKAHVREVEPLVYVKAIKKLKGKDKEERMELFHKYQKMLEGWGPFEKALDKLAKISKEKKIPVLMVLYNNYIGNMQDEYYNNLFEKVEEMSRNRNFKILNLKNHLIKFAEENHCLDKIESCIWHRPRDEHPSKAVHHLIGQLLFDNIKEMIK